MGGSSLSRCVVVVVGAALRRINLHQFLSHTDGAFLGGVSELVASCARCSFQLTVFGSMDGVGEAASATPLEVCVLQLCLCRCDEFSNLLEKQGDSTQDMGGDIGMLFKMAALEHGSRHLGGRSGGSPCR